MNSPANSGGLNHVVAIGIAAASFAFVAPWRADRDPFADTDQPPPPAIAYPLRGYLDNYRTEPYLAAVLERTLREGSSIVLLGSSELTTADHPAKPVNFFNNALKVPLLALGHAGNQSFSMHAQLIAANTSLERARLAILVSPSWFVDKSAQEGTALAAFLEYQPSPSFYRVKEQLDRCDPLSAPVPAYLAEHASELGAAQPIVRWMTRNATTTDRVRYCFSQPWDRFVADLTSTLMVQQPFVHEETSAWRMPDIGPEEWGAIYRDATREHLAQCTNNKVFVNDAYYIEHVHGNTRTLDTTALPGNREFRDFVRLLDHIAATKGDPLFILQPLNPYVYTNLPHLDHTMHAIRNELDQRNMEYFDMWISDTAQFQPGVLTDVMHLGPLGWYRIDSALMAKFR